jgi:hypothetical protein
MPHHTALAPITHGLSGFGRGCRCDRCRDARTDYLKARAAREQEKHERELNAELAHMLRTGTIRPFIPPRCARCRAVCVNADGKPRWHITFDFAFVCLNGCKAALS